jgi:hypothetical protein
MEYSVPESGPYQDDKLLDMLTKTGVQLIWFPEGAPETYSYTLSHAMRLGYPVIAPKFGAFPERIAGRDWTELTEMGQNGKDICDLMIRVRKKMLSEMGRQKP